MAHAQGRYDEAIQHYLQALRDYPNHVALWISLAQSAVEKKDFETARAALHRALELDPSRDDIRRALETLERMGANVEKQGSRAEVRANGTPPLQDMLAQANAAITQGNLHVARDILEQAIASYPDDIEVLKSLASVAMAQGDYWAAQDQLISAIELSPTDPELHNQLAIAYQRAGDYEMAARAFQQVLTLDPTNSDARAGLAELARTQRSA